MALFNNKNYIGLHQLVNETVSAALVTNGRKTLHVVTKFCFDHDSDVTEPYTEYQITYDRSLEGYSDFGMAVERYNAL
jgi:hypothetical protein